MSKITLVSPPLITYKKDVFGSIPSPPVGLAFVAAYLREQGFAVGLLDAFGADPFQHEQYRNDFVRIGLSLAGIIGRIEADSDFVGISVHSGMVSSFCFELAAAIHNELGI